MKILVIGSEGYVGSRLVPFLEKIGHDVMGLDNCYYGKMNRVLTGDYRNLDFVTTQVYEVVILLAAHSSVQLCEHDKDGSFENNVLNFKKIVGKLRKGQRLLYASSASVCNGSLNAKEDSPFSKPMCNYDMHKQMIEMYASMFDNNIIGMRFGSVSGYSPNPRLELLINSMYYDAITKGEISVSSENNMRSYLGLNDLCKSIAALIEHPNPEKIYNIASGSANIGDVANVISSITGAKIIKVEGNSTYSFSVNTDRIKKVFPLTDTIESICEELKDVITFDKSIFNRNTNLFKYVQTP